MNSYALEYVQQMTGYVPGEQPAHTDVVKLNTNENPYPPSPKVMEAVGRLSAESLRRYPNPTATPFRIAAAEVLGIGPDMIIAGNGSDDILTILMRTFVGSGGAVAYPVPTYALYRTLAQIEHARFVEIPFSDDYSLPAELASTNARLVFVCNPNSPTGTVILPDVLADFAGRTQAVVVVDEAYVDFADGSCLDMIRDHDNVLVVRTLSKGYALAGLRFGYAAGPRSLIEEMYKVKDSYNCDAVSIAAATAAIMDQKYRASICDAVRIERIRVIDELRRLGFDAIESHSNFVWATIDTPAAGQLYAQLKQRNILVRYFDEPGLDNGLRITIGTPEQNTTLLRTLGELLGN